MKGAMRCSYSTREEFLGHVLGFKVCRGYLAKVMVRGSRALATPVEELPSLLPVQPCLNVDETGHKENGKGLWTWCFRARAFVVFSIQASRGSDVLMELLGREFNGMLGCDYFSAYRKFLGQMIALAADTARLSPLQWHVEDHYPEALNVASRFRKHGDPYFTFITTPQVGATNNSAEQALRFVVMDRRATQGTRSHKGRLFCERI
jgi:hypothetical protein